MRPAIALLIAAGTVPAAPAWAVADCAKPPAIAFHKGSISATVSGGMIRTESACYTLSARAGQTLNVTVKSPDDNVVFTIYRPGYTVKAADDGAEVSGKTLAGAADENEAKSVRAKLPSSGRYLVELSLTRGGGGEYHMQVGIR